VGNLQTGGAHATIFAVFGYDLGSLHCLQISIFFSTTGAFKIQAHGFLDKYA
jgi:hypothetical protein